MTLITWITEDYPIWTSVGDVEIEVSVCENNLDEVLEQLYAIKKSWGIF